MQVRTGLLAAAVTTCAAALVLLAAPANADPAPEITLTPAPDPGNDTTPTWEFSYGGGGQLSCSLSGPGRNQQYTACSSPITYDLNGHADGTYTFAVRRQPENSQADAATVSRTYVLDTRAPVTITSSPASPSDASSGSWSFTAEAGATFECKLGLVGSNPSFSPCSSGKTFEFPTDGTYTFAVQATDPLGNTGPAATDTHVRQTVVPPPPPGTPVIASPLARIGQSPSSAWSFTADPGASTFCQLSPAGPNPSGFVACASPATYSLVTDGTYTFSVYATNASGTSATATDTYTLDRLPPAAPVIGSGPASPGTDPKPRWTFTAEAGSDTECMLAGESAVIAAWEPCSRSQSYRLPDAGSYVFSVRSRDTAGNTSPTTSAVYVFQPVDRKGTGPVEPPPPPPGDPTTPGNPTPESDATPPPAPLSSPAPTPAPEVRSTPSPAPQVSAPLAETSTRSGPPELIPTPAATPGSSITTAAAPTTTLASNQRPALPPPSPSRPGPIGESAAPPAVLPSQGEETIAETILDVGVKAVKKSAFPLLLLLIVFLFLVVQDRIDRRDPKLALAPVYRDAALSFTPPPTRSPPRHD